MSRSKTTDYIISLIPHPYIVVIISAVWLSSLSFITYIQYAAAVGTSQELSWGRTWVLLSPWFLNWIWVSICIFMVTKAVENTNTSFFYKVIFHLITSSLLLVSYLVTSTLIRGILVSRSWSGNLEALTRVLSSSVHVDILIYIGILASALGIRFYHSAMRTHIELRQLQTALVEEQLKTLRTQLNPHFLFNALNTVASLVRLKREHEAIKSLSALSTMLRTILDNKSRDEVKIRDEIEFIQSYLDIQKMRFKDKIDSHIQIDEDCYNLTIPSMILQPLVENAIQHGAQSDSKKNSIQLFITKKNNLLTIRMLNTAAQKNNPKGYGIGISNTKERLAKTFDDFSLVLTQLDNDIFETHLSIPASDAIHPTANPALQ